MAFTYNYTLTDFPNDKCDLNKFSEQIRNSTITAALDYCSQSLGFVTAVFRAELTNPDVSTLDNLVANHDGEPIPDSTPIVKSEQLTEHIKFVEAGDTTQGMFAAESLVVDISAGETEVTKDFSWPFDVALMSGTFAISEDMVGDEMNVHVGPNTLIGALIQPLSVGDTSIYCSSTVFENIKVGYYFGLYNGGGATGVEIGQVLAKDEENSVLTIDTPSDVSANAGSYVAMCAKIIPYMYLNSTDKIEIGKDVPTGQRIPANLPVRVNYFSNNSVAKKVTFFVEYLY